MACQIKKPHSTKTIKMISKFKLELSSEICKHFNLNGYSGLAVYQNAI